MAELESNTHPSAFFNIFRVSLTREQQTALTTLLPRAYSFQPYKCTRSLDEESLRSEPLKPTKSTPPLTQKRRSRRIPTTPYPTPASRRKRRP